MVEVGGAPVVVPDRRLAALTHSVSGLADILCGFGALDVRAYGELRARTGVGVVCGAGRGAVGRR